MVLAREDRAIPNPAKEESAKTRFGGAPLSAEATSTLPSTLKEEGSKGSKPALGQEKFGEGRLDDPR
jgi:hypothetical protein